MNKLIDIFGVDLMCGYDIGCGFSATANNSARLGDKVREKRARFCCGSFHGHAHCRLCQLDWHPLYIEGSGLEEYKGCERAFSDSNGTGRRTHYATQFHRQQILVLHFQRWDRDKYAELSTSQVIPAVILARLTVHVTQVNFYSIITGRLPRTSPYFLTSLRQPSAPWGSTPMIASTSGEPPRRPTYGVSRRSLRATSSG
jgi:hypothetical protein